MWGAMPPRNTGRMLLGKRPIHNFFNEARALFTVSSFLSACTCLNTLGYFCPCAWLLLGIGACSTCSAGSAAVQGWEMSRAQTYAHKIILIRSSYFKTFKG